MLTNIELKLGVSLAEWLVVMRSERFCSLVPLSYGGPSSIGIFSEDSQPSVFRRN